MREREGGGGSELILTLLEGGTYLMFPLVKLILGPPLPDNYCTVPYGQWSKIKKCRSPIFVRSQSIQKENTSFYRWIPAAQAQYKSNPCIMIMMIKMMMMYGNSGNRFKKINSRLNFQL